MDERGNVVTTTYTSYQMIAGNLTTSLERVSEQPDVARETEYYLANIGNVKTIDDFFADARLYNYAIKAHGLEDMGYAKAFMRKVLTEGIDTDDAFAKQLTDSRYTDLVELLNFARNGTAATSFEKAQKGVVDKYTRQTLEQNAGEENSGVRLALYFERMAPSITNAYGLLADDALAQVTRTLLQMPDEFAASDIDKQAAAIENVIDIKDFQDPTKLSKTARTVHRPVGDQQFLGALRSARRFRFIQRLRNLLRPSPIHQYAETRGTLICKPVSMLPSLPRLRLKSA